MSSEAVKAIIARKKESAARAAQDTSAPPMPNDFPLDFFRVSKDQNGHFKSVTILQSGFRDLLFRMGFRRYDVGESYILIRITDNVIEQVHPHKLVELITRYFRGLPDPVGDDCPKAELVEKLARSIGTLTTTEKLAALVDMDTDDTSINIVEDTQTTAYYFYRNGFVEVTKDGARLRPYSELPGYIWKDQIIQRDFVKMKPVQYESGAYYQFSQNVADNWLRSDGSTRNNPERFASFCTLCGYLLHRYFKTKLKTAIFLDARISDDPDGRSGKSLVCKALRQILNADPENGKQCIVIDGKEFNPENRFKYDELHPSTRLFVIDDVKRGLPIEMFFNAVVDGFVQELKGVVSKRRIWTKLILTLNYTIQIRGGSARDRVVEFEFADYYSAAKTPEMEFGHWFFRDWDTDEWQKFDNFMMSCVHDYLLAGIINPSTINLEARKLRDETSAEFINFMLDREIEHEKAYNKKELYKAFAEVDEEGRARNLDVAKFLKPKMFTQWLRHWAQYRPEMAGYREHRSDSKDWIRFFYNEPVSAEYLIPTGQNQTLKLFPGKSEKVTPKPTGDAVGNPDLPF